MAAPGVPALSDRLGDSFPSAPFTLVTTRSAKDFRDISYPHTKCFFFVPSYNEELPSFSLQQIRTVMAQLFRTLKSYLKQDFPLPTLVSRTIAGCTMHVPSAGPITIHSDAPQYGSCSIYQTQVVNRSNDPDPLHTLSVGSCLSYA